MFVREDLVAIEFLLDHSVHALQKVCGLQVSFVMRLSLFEYCAIKAVFIICAIPLMLTRLSLLSRIRIPNYIDVLLITVMLYVVRALNAALTKQKFPKKMAKFASPRRRVGAHEEKALLLKVVSFIASTYLSDYTKRMDVRSKQAVRHTLHCLTGCGIGETVGSAIGAQAGWPNVWQTVLAVVLAFAFGYGLTFRGARKMGLTAQEAARTALSTDTISIISMEIVDNTLEYVIPGAMNAVVASWLFWWSLAVSLAVAFVITVPINRFVMTRSGSHHKH